LKHCGELVMEHVRQTELIQLAANELADPRRAEVEHHLAECPVCQALFEQQATVWRTLGEWTPDASERDLLTGVERKLAERPAVLQPFWFGVGRLSRIAAAIVIGVGAGYGAARTWSPARSSPPPVASAASEQAVTEALGIEYFEDPSPAGLYAALQDMSAASEPEEGQS
jgi:hypothetical protein